MAHSPRSVDEATLAPPAKKPPRFGLGADGTSSPAGLIVKIVALAWSRRSRSGRRCRSIDQEQLDRAGDPGRW